MHADTQLPNLGVLESVERTVPLWRHVRVDEGRLAEVCAEVTPDALRLPGWEVPAFMHDDLAALAGQVLLFNAINFCYWGDPKWTISYRGQSWDGSYGVLMAIQRGVAEGLPLLDGAYLAQLSAAEFRHVLRGSGELHLMPERLAIWREVGAELVRSYGGRFTTLIAEAEGDAIALASLLIGHFPSFEDRWSLEGQEVRFYKRAQLAVAMLFEASGGQGWGRLAGTERLTVFADYKLPQVLRRLGVLVYDEELAATIDNLRLLPAGSRPEVELRAATIWAAELMRRKLAASMPDVTALHVDYWLWQAGQVQGPGMRPYHRTLGTAY